MLLQAPGRGGGSGQRLRPSAKRSPSEFRKGDSSYGDTCRWVAGSGEPCSCFQVPLWAIKEHFTWSMAQIYVAPTG